MTGGLSMEFVRQVLDGFLPDNFNPTQYFVGLLIAICAIAVVVGIFRLCFGKGSLINVAISSSISILSIYVLNMLIFSFGTKLQILFEPLPFVTVTEDCLTIFPIFDASFRDICKEIFKMLILAYLINLLESWLPKGNNMLSWFSFRFLALAIAVCLNYCLSTLLNTVCHETVMENAPFILLAVVLFAFLLGCLKLLIGGALTFVNPLLGLFYAFFFSQNIGKQLMRAMVTTVVMTILVCALNYLSYTVFSTASVALLTYLPIILLGLLLWYLIAKFL